jgi:hypothetical protein
MNAVLNDETADEADNPELVLDDAPDIVIPHVPRPCRTPLIVSLKPPASPAVFCVCTVVFHNIRQLRLW